MFVAIMVLFIILVPFSEENGKVAIRNVDEGMV